MEHFQLSMILRQLIQVDMVNGVNCLGIELIFRRLQTIEYAHSEKAREMESKAVGGKLTLEEQYIWINGPAGRHTHGCPLVAGTCQERSREGCTVARDVFPLPSFYGGVHLDKGAVCRKVLRRLQKQDQVFSMVEECVMPCFLGSLFRLHSTVVWFRPPSRQSLTTF